MIDSVDTYDVINITRFVIYVVETDREEYVLATANSEEAISEYFEYKVNEYEKDALVDLDTFLNKNIRMRIYDNDIGQNIRHYDSSGYL